MISFEPLHDRVILTPVEKPKTKGGIILPENDSNPWAYALVEAIGPGITNMNGQLMPTKAKIGDIVLHYKCDLTPLEIDNKSYFTIRETQLIGIYKRGEIND